MGSVLNSSDRTTLVTRMQSLSASSPSKWGKLNVVGMLQHLRLSMRMAVGELPVASVNKKPFQVFPLKHLILYVLPFPKGAPTAVELYPGDEGAFEEERTAVLALMEQIGVGPTEGMGPAHPLFGPLSWGEWGIVTHKHVDHHLKQFGV